MNLNKLFRIYYAKIITSIAFIPGVIAVGYLILTWGMLEIDFSEFGKHLKSNAGWLSLKDASTARTIIATIAAAVLSLTVFSFSMVMIVLNQAASQMSNRVLTSMIQNRFQQVILGVYIGTIVYGLFLLSTIRDTNKGIYVPSLSIYVLIFFTVIDIFLFIYFLDYVTKTVKYETVIDRIEGKTLDTISKTFKPEEAESFSAGNLPFITIKTPSSNYFQSFNEESLLKIAVENNIYFNFMYKRNTYLVKDIFFLNVHNTQALEQDIIDEINSHIDFYKGQPINLNADYGCMQLAEVAIKALSPGINDPATAVISLNALSTILAQRMYTNIPQTVRDNKGEIRIYCPASGFADIFEECFLPIWNYGKDDKYIKDAMIMTVKQLQERDTQKKYTDLFNNFIFKIGV